MNEYIYYNPTRLVFGKNQIQTLKDELGKFGKKVLVVYGGGSIKRNGLYDEVMNELNKMDAEVSELSGVEPNPRVSTVRKGVEICKEKGIDVLLAVGGGSVIDCTKAIAAGASTGMFGQMFGGTEESPGRIIFHTSRGLTRKESQNLSGRT